MVCYQGITEGNHPPCGFTIIFGIVEPRTEEPQRAVCVHTHPCNEPCKVASFVVRSFITLPCKIGERGSVEILPSEYKRESIFERLRMYWFDLFEQLLHDRAV